MGCSARMPFSSSAGHAFFNITSILRVDTREGPWAGMPVLIPKGGFISRPFLFGEMCPNASRRECTALKSAAESRHYEKHLPSKHATDHPLGSARRMRCISSTVVVPSRTLRIADYCKVRIPFSRAISNSSLRGAPVRIACRKSSSRHMISKTPVRPE